MKLSDEIMKDVHAPNCHSVTDADGRCTCYIGRWHDDVRQLEAEPVALREKYNELVFAVATKCPDETRHETALRYIFEAEQGSIEAMQDALLQDSE